MCDMQQIFGDDAAAAAGSDTARCAVAGGDHQFPTARRLNVHQPITLTT